MITKNICPFCTNELIATGLQEVETFSGCTTITTYQCATKDCIGTENKKKIFWDAEGRAYSMKFEKSDDNKLHHKWNKLRSAINSLEWWNTAIETELVPKYEVLNIKFKKHRIYIKRVSKGTYPNFYYQFKISLEKQREVKSKRLSQRTIPVGRFAYDVVASCFLPFKFKFTIQNNNQ